MEMIKKLDLINLNQAKESFIDYLDVNDLTLKSYKAGIDKFMNYLKENDIKSPKRDDVISFRNFLRNNFSSNTVNAYMVAVKSMFKYLEIHQLYNNISKDVKGAKYDTTPRKQVLTQEQVKNIYVGLTNIREKALFGLFVTTGLRVTEVNTALIEDIKIHNDEVVLFIKGKKRDSKTDYVKLSEQVVNDIKNYIGNRTSGSIFISTSNVSKGKGLSSESLRKICKGIFKNFGIDSDTLSCHSLRRTFSVIAYENGADIYQIKDVLRHESINTTTRYLKQVDRNNNKTEVNVSNVLLGGV